MPATPSQAQLPAEQSETEFHKGAVSGSLTLPSAAQALHISSRSLTLPSQPVLHSEKNSVSTDYQTVSSSARAFLDVLSTPDMRDLDELVVTAVAANWQRVALRLGVEIGVSKVVLEAHPNDCEGACRDMLDRWLRGEHHTGGEERTWSTLLTALGRARFVELEGSLRRERFPKQ